MRRVQELMNIATDDQLFGHEAKQIELAKLHFSECEKRAQEAAVTQIAPELVEPNWSDDGVIHCMTEKDLLAERFASEGGVKTPELEALDFLVRSHCAAHGDDAAKPPEQRMMEAQQALAAAQGPQPNEVAAPMGGTPPSVPQAGPAPAGAAVPAGVEEV